MKKHLLAICLTLGTIFNAQGQCTQNADFTVGVGQTSTHLIAMNAGNNLFVNQSIIIYDNFLVQNDLTFVDCELFMAPDAVIAFYQPAYHNLEFINSSIQACDNAMWKGIKYDAGYLLLDNTTIRDAEFAVRANGTNQNTKFDIVNSQFLNNHNHLTISGQIDLSSTVYSSTFNVLGALLPPYDNLNSAQIGIDINQVMGWTFGSQNPTLANQLHNFRIGFKTLFSGVDIINTHFSNPSQIFSDGVDAFGHADNYINISNCSFTNLNKGVTTTTIDILVKDSEFSHCDMGIRTNYGKLDTIRISHNTFDYCYSAAIYNFQNITTTTRIDKNTITNTPRPIFSMNLTAYVPYTDYKGKANCIHGASSGWTLINVPSPELYHNTIEAQHTGLSMANCVQASITGNDFVGPGNGIFGIYASMSSTSDYDQNRFQGFANGIWLANDYHSQLTNNVFINGYHGIYLTNNTELGEQGSVDQPQNNHWLQPHFQENNPDHFPIAASINIDQDDATFFFTPNVAELNPWSNPIAATTIATDNGVLAPPYAYFECVGIPQDLPPVAGRVPPVPSGWADYSPSRYIQELQLLDLLDQLPPEQLSTEHHDFVSQKQSSTQEHIVRLRQEIEQAHYAQAQDRNQGISPANPIEDFTKTFYSTLLVWLQDSAPFSQLSAQEQTTVRQWAALCPFEYGPEVYSARTIAHSLDTAWQSYAHPCEGNIPNTLARLQGTEEGLKAYPNPFVDELHIESSAQRLVFYDLRGREQHRQVLSNNTQAIRLDHLPIGIYLLKAYDEQGNQIDQK
ncbi:MAG: T9SS type A sorting domain-containing protein, partial [Flavobacteriales bacterium]